MRPIRQDGSKSTNWFLISLLLFTGSFAMWRYAQKEGAQSAATIKAQSAINRPLAAALTKVSNGNGPGKAKSYHLSNTTAKTGDLLRNSHAILLRNASIDTSRPLKLDIPEHLRAKGTPGSYIVQSDRPLDQPFYDQLKKDGVEYVSFIPNDAALVRCSAEQAQVLTNDAFFQAVIPYEPYYKMESALLPDAVEQRPGNTALSVTVFPGQRDAALSALTGLGAQLMGEDQTPFGPTLVVTVPPDSLTAVAQLPMAQEIERYTPRRMANDLSRVQMGISQTTLLGGSNYLGLTGSNVMVNLNDTGVDATHPDLTGRIFGVQVDNDGHGTHVAGIIAGNGSESSKVPGPVPGSIIPGADFRGKATNASLYVQSLDLVLGPRLSDAALAQSTSINLGPTNLISNNSWGYGDMSYDMHAATYDAATRDAQPNVSGEQPVLFVFAAGNNGGGNDTGIGGQSGTITSPGTAKNVITVGATDLPRFITNDVDYSTNTYSSGDTNGSPVFLGDTDNSNLVSDFSSCGNVDLGIEGTYGRFKPDVVAPGVFVVSCRSASYQVPTNATYVTYYPFTNQVLTFGQTNYYNYFNIPPDTSEIILQVTSNNLSPQNFPPMLILGDPTPSPMDVLGTNSVVMTNVAQYFNDLFYFGVTPATNTPQPVNFDFTIYLFETNNLGDYYEVISNLDNGLTNYYRFETGTSMSAGAVSGTLALMQQYLQQKLTITNPSPALLKAMLINGSRSIDYIYDYNVNPLVANEQGWGMPNISNSIPPSLGSNYSSMILVNQSTNNALATGQSQSYTVSCTDPLASNAPVRVTLVWTDPPGNPAAGVALVNNLALLVQDASGTNYYVGNNFPSGEVFTELESATNSAALATNLAAIQYDTINNVQNVYIGTATAPIQFPLTVTVLGNHVNVNAVTTETNLIAQDYALVISSDDTALTAALTVTSNTIAPPAPTTTNALVTLVSNGVPLLHERVGANEPNIYQTNPITGTNGDLSGWHFFVFTNNILGTNGGTSEGWANVAITTFQPPEMSIPRASDNADIDMYVARSSTIANYSLLTNLNATVISQCDKSLSQGGTETIIYTNSPSNEVFCVGIKSEDQQGADFGFYAVAQKAPFSTQNQDGSVTAYGTGLPVNIPASTINPALVFAFLFSPNNPSMTLRKVEITDGLTHQNADALYGIVQHNGTTSVLNNFTGNPNGFTNTYDDLPDNAKPSTPMIKTDPPGTLKNFVGQSGQGMWELTETDYAPFLVGQVNQFVITAYPQPPGNNFTITIPGQSWFYDYVVVPNDATNMTISVVYENNNSAGPVGIYITNSDNVGFGDYGSGGIVPPGGYLSYGITNVPPLDGGTWYYGIYNSNTAAVTLNVQIQFQEALVPNLSLSYTNNTWTPLTTDGHTQSTICISNGDILDDLSVGLVVADPNLDDLVIHLTSPEGTSVLLFEDRGGLAATNLGLVAVSTNGGVTNYNYTYTVFTEDTNLTTTPIKFGTPPFASTNISGQTTITSNGFEGLAAGIYTNGQPIGGGWMVATNTQVGIVTDRNNAYNGSNFLALATGRITNTFTTIPGASYELIYWAKPPQIADWWTGDDSAEDLVGGNTGVATAMLYDVGEVARAFSFNGSSSVVTFGDIGNFETNDFSADFWIKTTDTNEMAIIGERPTCSASVSFWDIRISGANKPHGCIFHQETSNGSVDFFRVISNHPIDDGIYHHVAFVRKTGTAAIYVDGVLNVVSNDIPAVLNNSSPFLMGHNVCDGADGTSAFNGDLDEVDLWTRGLSSVEVAAIYNAGVEGKYNSNSLYPNFQVTVDGVSTNIVILTNFSGGWQPYTNSFVATNTSMTVELSGQTLSTLFDNVQIIQLPLTNYHNYFLPEEPLTPLIGQNPTGCWTLDIWDTRTDSSLSTNGMLLSWNLQETVSSTNVNLIVLTNAQAVTITNSSNLFTYFGIDVPETANFATNMLFNISGGPVSLLFNQQQLPTGSLPGDFTLLSMLNAKGTNTISTQGMTPQLVPNRRYYLGVENNSATPSTFTLEVQFDVGNNTNIVILTNNMAFFTNIDLFGDGEFYVFTNVPATATEVVFQIVGVNQGEMDLYAREGLPVPGPWSFDYQSRNQGTNDQFIVITTNSAPVPLPTATTNDMLPLSPTTWYLSVYGTPSTTVLNTYTIIATYLTNNSRGGPGAVAIISLTNGVPYTNTVTPRGFPTNVLYSFAVGNTPAGLEFVVSNYTGVGNVELFDSDGVFPTPENFHSGSFNPGSVNQTNIIGTNGELPNFNGTWYLAVANTSSTNVPYTITATTLSSVPVTILAPELQFVAATMMAPPTNGFTITWLTAPNSSYQVEVSTDLITWSAVTNVTATSTEASYTDPTPISTQTARFFRVILPQ